MTIQDGKPADKTNEELQFEKDLQFKDGISCDVFNAVFGTGLSLSNQDRWSRIKPISTYEEYMHRTKSLELAEKVINYKHNNLKRIEEFNSIISNINEIIGDSVTSQDQVDKLKVELENVRKVLYE